MKEMLLLIQMFAIKKKPRARLYVHRRRCRGKKIVCAMTFISLCFSSPPRYLFSLTHSPLKHLISFHFFCCNKITTTYLCCRLQYCESNCNNKKNENFLKIATNFSLRLINDINVEEFP